VDAGAVPARIDGAERARGGDWRLAEYTALQMLDHDAAYGGSHYAIALVRGQQGDTAGEKREMQEARRFWRDADKDLPELKQIATASTR
jgi:hypothetical protein